MGSGVSVTQGSFDGDTQSVSFPKRKTTQNDEIQRGIIVMIDSVIDQCIRKSNVNVQALCPTSKRKWKDFFNQFMKITSKRNQSPVCPENHLSSTKNESDLLFFPYK